MSTAPLVPQRLAWPVPKYILLQSSASWSPTFFAIETFLIDPRILTWPHIQPFRWWLLRTLDGRLRPLAHPCSLANASAAASPSSTHRRNAIGRRVFVAAPLGFTFSTSRNAAVSPESFSTAAAVALRAEELPESWKEYFGNGCARRDSQTRKVKLETREEEAPLVGLLATAPAQVKILSAPAPIFHFLLLVSALSFCLLLSSPPQ